METNMSTAKHSDAGAATTTRRKVLAAAALAMSGIALPRAVSSKVTADEISKSEESIRQQILFTASRKRLYDALTDAKQFDQVARLSAAMQGGMPPGAKPTRLSSTPSSEFALFGGHIVGRQIELVANARIVQAWRAGNWDPGSYSIARFELIEQGSGTQLLFEHTGFPKGQSEHLAAGWKENYWEPLEKFLK